MGNIASYHPVFWVGRGDAIYRLDVTCDNWYDDSEVIGRLADIAGAVTIGEIVEQVGQRAVSGGFILDTRCRKLPSMDGAFAQQDVLDWDMPVGQVGRIRYR